MTLNKCHIYLFHNWLLCYIFIVFAVMCYVIILTWHYYKTVLQFKIFFGLISSFFFSLVLATKMGLGFRLHIAFCGQTKKFQLTRAPLCTCLLFTLLGLKQTASIVIHCVGLSHKILMEFIEVHGCNIRFTFYFYQLIWFSFLTNISFFLSCSSSWP